MRAFVLWIRGAAPYIHAFRGKTFVIAFGGEVVADESFLGVIHDLNLLHVLGIAVRMRPAPPEMGPIRGHGSRPWARAARNQSLSHW